MIFVSDMDEAFIGLGTQFNKSISVYDYDKCVKLLMKKNKFSYEEALEWMEYNVIGAWVGEFTPIFLSKMSIDEAREVIENSKD